MSDDVIDKNEQKKFFFNQNIFDEDYVDPEEEPPAPTFSEEEMRDAQDKAFKKGHTEGSEEAKAQAKASQGEMVARALDQIASTSATLFAEEEARELRFERESVALAQEIFETLFPLYKKEIGFEDFKNKLESVLEKHRKVPHIDIFVSPDNKDGVEQFLSKLQESGHNGEFVIHSDKNLSDSACRLAWPQGGASFDKEKIAEEIRAIISEVLAGEPTNSHDNKDKVEDVEIPSSGAEEEKQADVQTEEQTTAIEETENKEEDTEQDPLTEVEKPDE